MAADKRPDVLFGSTPRIKTGCGNLYMVVNDEGGLARETLVMFGKAGGCASATTQAVARLSSLALSLGASREDVAEKLSGIGCPHPSLECISCMDGIAQILRRKDAPQDVPLAEQFLPAAEYTPLD